MDEEKLKQLLNGAIQRAHGATDWSDILASVRRIMRVKLEADLDAVLYDLPLSALVCAEKLALQATEPTTVTTTATISQPPAKQAMHDTKANKANKVRR